MSSSKGPNLRIYLDKPVCVHLNKNRKVTGTLRGYDQFMNIVLDGAEEDTSSSATTTASMDKNDMGMVVIRGNSIVQFELLR